MPAATKPTPAVPVADERCPRCTKPLALCMCDRVVVHNTHTEVLVLQHPSEKNELLATVPFLVACLPRVTVRPGLSWPSLGDALGRPADPRDWAVLYRGSLPRALNAEEEKLPAVRMDRRGRPLPLRPPPRGLVVIDATWQRAKTLWWRNPWFVKLQRIVLHPAQPSIYGALRKEPDKHGLSTLEAVAETLVAFGESPALRDDLRKLMRTFAQRVRDTSAKAAPPPDASPRKPDRRRGALATRRRAPG